MIYDKVGRVGERVSVTEKGEQGETRQSEKRQSWGEWRTGGKVTER